MSDYKQRVERALQQLREGKMVVLLDDESRENEGDVILAAQFATPEALNFITTHCRGLVCCPMAASHFARLGLTPMVEQNKSKYDTAFGVSFGAAEGIGSGISTYDRAYTIRLAADPQSGPADIVKPGHVFPLKARDMGVLERPGHTEGAVDLMRLAGLEPVAAICEVMNPDGTMARAPELTAFAKQHDLVLLTIADLITYRMRHEVLVDKLSESVLPIKSNDEFTIQVYQSHIDGRQHVAMLANTGRAADKPVLLRMHSECLTGDALGSRLCDCGSQLQKSLDLISEEGGVLLYLRQEGRGIGLANKIKAYALQAEGMDTVEANQHLGFEADCRDYGIAAQILKQLELDEVELVTNNPAKVEGLQRYGVHVTKRRSLEMKPSDENISYLRTKREKMGHWLSNLDEKQEVVDA